jgi:hypothetical protein
VSARRLRLGVILGIAILAALELLADTQSWWTITVPGKPIAVAGTVAAPGLAALALCGLALAGALAISGPVFRLVLGILEIMIGGTVVLSAATAIAAPAKASASLITAATGISGEGSVNSLVENIGFTAWPRLARVARVLAIAVGVVLLATAKRWPGPSRKYQAVRFEDAGTPRDSVGDWDSLSDGDDPTV